jgi:tryptophan-rich sensory protein
MVRLPIRSGILLAACILLPLIIGAIGSLFTYPHIAGWFAGLSKPWFSPPNWIFGPVWTILYIFMGISLWLVIRHGWEDEKIRQGMALFGLQLGANFLWSVIFFALHSPAGALIDILVLLVLIAGTILAFRKISPHASYLLVPYLCWVSFATILNAAIVILN